MNTKSNMIKKRLDKLRAKLLEKGLDAAFVTKRENYIYLSGFTGTYANLIITKDSAVLLTDFRYAEQASKQALLFDIVDYKGNYSESLNDILSKREIGKIGFEESNVTYAKYLEYMSILKIREFVPLGGIIESIRMTKDSEEIKIISKAVDIADKSFSHILNYIKPGISEIDIAAELEFNMKKLGAKGPSFDTIIASGERSSMPHGVASSKKLDKGDAITLDFGAVFENYCSDMTRTVFLGEPKKELKEIYGVVLKAQAEAINGAKAGLLGKDIDLVARNIINNSGYEGRFGHGLGHSVGLEIHEEPRFSPTGNIIMENSMVVTVEPGIYISGLGGVRIEDIIVINDEKPLILTRSTKDIIIL